VVFGAVLVMAADSIHERRFKLVGGAVALGILIIVGMAQFLLGLFEYTAVYVFRSDLLNPHQTWWDVSIAFNSESFSVWGPCLFAMALAGGVGFALATRGLQR